MTSLLDTFTIRHFIPLGMHNLFYATLSLIAGISLQFLQVPFGLQILVVTIPILAGLTYKEITKNYNWYFFLIPLFIVCGSLLCFLQLESQKKFFKQFCNQIVDVKGAVSSFEMIVNPRFKYKIIVDIDTIKISSEKNDPSIRPAIVKTLAGHSGRTEQSIHGEYEQSECIEPCFQNTSANIALYVRSKNDLEVGDYIQLNALTFKDISNQSFKNYLAKEKIVATLFLETFEFQLLKKPSFSLNKYIFYLRESIFATLKQKINKESFALFSSIFLGNRSSVKKEMESKKESFKIWGTSHYLARSGLHLVIFVIIWHFILSLLPIAYRLKQIFLLALIILYALLSWSSVSFERALLMVIIYKWCLLTDTPSHYVHLIVLVTCGVLLINPLQLFFLDFQLSFGLTFALAWFNHIQSHKNRAKTVKVL